jgi:predicted DsbA family dithiol-disulfide isomerase
MLLGCILALSGAGAWISGELVRQHADLWGASGTHTGLFGRICEASEQWGLSCAGLRHSAFAEISLPIPLPTADFTIRVARIVVPTAFVGLAYFMFMVIWFTLVGRPRPYGRRWHCLPLALGICGVLASLFFVGLMALGKAPWCMGCVAVHVINLLMVLMLWQVASGTEVPAAKAISQSSSVSPVQTARMTMTRRQVAGVIALWMIVVAGLWVYRSERIALQGRYDRLLPYRSLVKSFQADPEFLLREYYAQPAHEIPPRSDEPVAEGRARLVIFTDFECPACYCRSQALQAQVSEAFAEQLAVQIRHYPLCADCNDRVKTGSHPNACDAAYAAEAARLQGGNQAFEQMYVLLFKNSKDLGRKLYRDLADQIGLNADRLLYDMHDDTVRQIVAADIALGEPLGVRGTPTVFLNGRRVTELCQTTVFWQAVAADWPYENEELAAIRP